MTRLRAALCLLLLCLSGCTASRPNRAGQHPSDPPLSSAFQLTAFDSCADLLQGLRTAAKAAVGPWGFTGGRVAYDKKAPNNLEGDAVRANAGAVPDAAPAADAFSTTNTHEVGVDEPDLVKTDGKRIVTVQNGILKVVDVASRQVTGSLTVQGTVRGKRAYGGADELLLAGDRALLFGYDYPADATSTAVSGAGATLVDLTGPPKIIGRLLTDGTMLDARQIGSTVRLVTRSAPRVGFPESETADDTNVRIAANRAAIDHAPLADWLPRYAVEDASGKRTEGHVDCSAVSRPAVYSGTSLLTILTFDLAKLTGGIGDGNPVSLVADGDLVYASGPNLYVTNDQRWRMMPMQTDVIGAGKVPVGQARTQLYKFDISGADRPRFLAAGEVPGWLLNQYSLSEFDGHLRVAVTQGLPGQRANPPSESSVVVLDQQGSRLTQVGQVGGLGKGEQIYSVRFIGTTGYLVTFRQTDPLFTVDLRDPTAPKVSGELKVNGYSAYLHPAGDGRLLGVGQSADAQGRTQGTQVSLFDVSDLAAPKRLAQQQLPASNSEAEYDPHAFLYWQPTGLLVVPYGTYTSEKSQPGALVLEVHDGALMALGKVTHPDPGDPIRRSLIIGGTLWTVSNGGLKATDATTLHQLAWVAF